MEFIGKYNKKRERFSKFIYDHSLWKRFEEGRVNTGKPELKEQRIAFLTQCMSENLHHARHIENERITFNSVFLAFVAGVIVFIKPAETSDSFLSPGAVCSLYFVLSIAGGLSILFTIRWNNAFERHLFYAQQCYRILHGYLFGKGDEFSDYYETPEFVQGINELPMYCFKIHRPIAATKFGSVLYKVRTKTLYIAFYWIIELILIGFTILSLTTIF